MEIILPQECLKWARLQRPQGDYLTEIKTEWKIIEPHLPSQVKRIVDIGCGLAGIQIFLKRKYPRASLSLLDGDGDKPIYGFTPHSSAYGCKDLTERFLKANNVTIDQWLPIDHPETIKADLVISLLSWGFHYPLSNYKVSGLCLADLRKNHEPVRGLIIHETLTAFRCLWTS